MSEKQCNGLDFKVELAKKAELVNGSISEYLSFDPQIEGRLGDAMRYVLESPGKRVRGALILWCCELVGGEVNRAAEMASIAVEMVHAYSLVHDDLPAMDDDDLRRGQLTCHKKFDEATAILAGDGLLTLAFEVLATEIEDAAVAVRLIKVLSGAAGPHGMVAGQMADIGAEKSEADIDQLEFIHNNKTAKMFAAAAMMGAVAGGGDDGQVAGLYQYGLEIGQCFQITDDLLDVSATSDELGKTPGKDAEQGKVTYPAIVGIEESKEIAAQSVEYALELLDGFGEKADVLRVLAKELLERTK
jgi:geranylgeranyl diphosphate synthase type II